MNASDQTPSDQIPFNDESDEEGDYDMDDMDEDEDEDEEDDEDMMEEDAGCVLPIKNVFRRL